MVNKEEEAKLSDCRKTIENVVLNAYKQIPNLMCDYHVALGCFYKAVQPEILFLTMAKLLSNRAVLQKEYKVASMRSVIRGWQKVRELYPNLVGDFPVKQHTWDNSVNLGDLVEEAFSYSEHNKNDYVSTYGYVISKLNPSALHLPFREFLCKFDSLNIPSIESVHSIWDIKRRGVVGSYKPSFEREIPYRHAFAFDKE